ncbi:uncharacterized protein LOC111599773 isoform X2 [Drosophila hydei]|uniref:Uncharacterized protein LOC111599773 isoform X2 n=1 Tax=Drosophila hydei TaxID=7224 RepID=A0A6J1LTL6_DROHY|nr:uncharacterized protein LOC111599773 isoform X2 [Drosophila hydei]
MCRHCHMRFLSCDFLCGQCDNFLGHEVQYILLIGGCGNCILGANSGAINCWSLEVKIWLIFSIIGFIVDIGFSIWIIVSAITVDWVHLKEFFIIFVGIFIESICIYLVYKYYLGMDPYQQKTTKKKRDEKACKGTIKVYYSNLLRYKNICMQYINDL